jgi:hypothetical protein
MEEKVLPSLASEAATMLGLTASVCVWSLVYRRRSCVTVGFVSVPLCVWVIPFVRCPRRRRLKPRLVLLLLSLLMLGSVCA